MQTSTTTGEAGTDQIAPSTDQVAPITDQQMEELLQQNLPNDQLRPGAIVKGTVIDVNDDRILLDLKHKSEGVVLAKEMRTLELEHPLSKGDVVDAYVLKSEANTHGVPMLSIDRAQGAAGWAIIEEKMKTNETITGKIVEVNRGGLSVLCSGVVGFVPISHLSSPLREMFNEETQDLNAIHKEVHGQPIECKVLDFNERRNRAIFSHRMVVQEEKERRRTKLLETIQEGQIITGSVTGISAFGAFVDIGGTDGLVHISEISWTPVRDISAVLSVGQKVEVAVIKVDRKNLKVALSLKKLQPEPWQSVEEMFHEGQEVNVTITNVVQFGAFAQLAPGIEGLIHLSEFSYEKIDHPNEVVEQGQELKAVVMRIDAERRRMALSIKRLKARPEKQQPAAEAPAPSAEPAAEAAEPAAPAEAPEPAAAADEPPAEQAGEE